MRALEAARDALYRRSGKPASDALVQPSEPTFEQQNADALGLLAESALNHEMNPGAPGERHQVVLHVQDDQAVLEAGTHVSAEPAMWREPLPILRKRSTIACGGPEVGDVTGPVRGRRGT
jgi:hypothetical protein